MRVTVVAFDGRKQPRPDFEKVESALIERLDEMSTMREDIVNQYLIVRSESLDQTPLVPSLCAASRDLIFQQRSGFFKVQNQLSCDTRNANLV
jgi:hypothetical protein